MKRRFAVAGALRLLIDLAFPEHCLLCGLVLEPGRERRAPVCPSCAGRLAPLTGRRCARCGVPLISEETVCTRCRERTFAFDRHRSLFEYRGDARELVYHYKFKGRYRIGFLFAGLMAESLPEARTGAAVVPVPSRPRTARARGFAPVEFLARRFARLSGLPFVSCLARTGGVSQKTLDFGTRMANLAGRIAALPSAARLAGRDVLLVDDIFTTGATANECAAVLKKAGAKTVIALTVAMET